MRLGLRAAAIAPAALGALVLATVAQAAAPRGVVLSGPVAQTASRLAPISFAVTPAGSAATTACSLDGSAFAPCSSPRTYHGLALGTHTFAVQAVGDGADSTPASITWTIVAGSNADALAAPATTAYGVQEPAPAPAPSVATSPASPSASAPAAPTGPAAAAASSARSTAVAALVPQGGSRSIPLSRFGAFGDGVHDDAGALQAAVQGALEGWQIDGDPDATYLIGSTITIDRRVILDLQGATLKKADWMSGAALRVTAPDVSVRRLTLDGNNVAGDGIAWLAPRGTLIASTIRSTKASGVSVTGAGASLAATAVTSNGNVSGVFSGRGFYAGSGAVLTTDAACSASGNDFAGFQVDRGSTGTINGIASGNRNGVVIYGTGGSSTTLSGTDNDRFGLLLDYKASRWKFGSVTFARTGISTGNPSGTGIEIFGGSDNSIAVATITSSTGYGVALSKDRDGNPAMRNAIGKVVVRAAPGDSDPAVHLSGGASDNTFADITATGTTSAVSIGEDSVPLTNDRNRFTKIKAVDNPYCVVKIKGGSQNVFQSITAQNVGTVDPVRICSGVVELIGPSTRRNTITIRISTARARTVNAVHADADATANVVTLTTLAKTTGPVLKDDAKRNTFKLIKAAA